VLCVGKAKAVKPEADYPADRLMRVSHWIAELNRSINTMDQLGRPAAQVKETLKLDVALGTNRG